MRRLFLKSLRRSRRTFANDASLDWARAHTEVARKALEQPAFTNPYSSPLDSYEDYWKNRNWNLPNEHAKDLVTHVLTHPLTLAYYMHKMMHASDMKSMHWCCVGARNESTLPHYYWKELLASLPRASKLTIEFLGPEMSLQQPQTMTFNDSTLHLLWSEQKLLHEAKMNSSWNAFVLFNPGLGHPNLQKGWEPSLDVLLQHGGVVLVTAHSKLDADRDAKVLQERLHRPIVYTANPFASRVQFNDPLSTVEHLVSTNQYGCWIK